MESFLDSPIVQKLENNKMLMAIRQGMLMSIPWLLVGSFALLLNALPIPAYQDFISTAFAGYISRFFVLIYNVTLGSITLIVLLNISAAYGRIVGPHRVGILPIATLCGYLALLWKAESGYDFNIFLSTYLFVALLVTIISCLTYKSLVTIMERVLVKYQGFSFNISMALEAVLPVAFNIILFSLLNFIITDGLGVEDITQIFPQLMTFIFGGIGTGVLSGMFYVFMVQFLWFFGIHGGNVMEGVAQIIYSDTAGVLSKSFFDTFAFFGGTGTILCFALAVFLSPKENTNRNLTKLGLLPALFNMNELFVFGVPIVLNPVYLIPFILVPVVLTAVAYGAVAFGIVPLAVNEVNWTTPIFLSGYTATGSLAGSILQLVSLALGTAIYYPFIQIHQRIHTKALTNNIRALEEMVKEHEERSEVPKLLENPSELGTVAKNLALELRSAIENHELDLFYQPQIKDKDHSVFGAEGLLRWRHPIGGYLYPPLVIALAAEDGSLSALEQEVLTLAGRNLPELLASADADFILSVNLTANELTKESVLGTLERLSAENDFELGHLALELTEQVAMSTNKTVYEHMVRLRTRGVKLMMDDFGMGHSTALHLRSDIFDYVKLDGSLVREVLTNKRSAEIISSITRLSENLGFGVIAEYVESEEQEKYLHHLGCDVYQGYVYAKPLPLAEFKDFLAANKDREEND